MWVYEDREHVCLTYLLCLAWWLVLNCNFIHPPLMGRTTSQSSGFSLFVRAFWRVSHILSEAFILWESYLDHNTPLEGWWQTLRAGCVWCSTYLIGWGIFGKNHSFHLFIYSANNYWVYSVLGTALGAVDSMSNEWHGNEGTIHVPYLPGTFARHMFRGSI